MNDKVGEAMEELGFCGCGSPENALSLLLDALEWCGADDERKMSRNVGPIGERGMMLALYVLDARNFIEHGGAVIDGWLTDEGRAFLAKYRYAVERRS